MPLARAGEKSTTGPTGLSRRSLQASSQPCHTAPTSAACRLQRARMRRVGSLRGRLRCRAASHSLATSRAPSGPRAPPPGCRADSGSAASTVKPFCGSDGSAVAAATRGGSAGRGSLSGWQRQAGGSGLLDNSDSDGRLAGGQPLQRLPLARVA
jgi:hypothetical protein